MVEGISLLLTTPAILIALWARRPRPLVVAAALSVLLLAVPLVLYYNTGWWQFGYRFSLDFMTPLFVLIAMGPAACALAPASPDRLRHRHERLGRVVVPQPRALRLNGVERPGPSMRLIACSRRRIGLRALRGLPCSIRQSIRIGDSIR